MPSSRVRDLDVYYSERGRGHSLVLVHGLGGSHEIWNREFVDLLSRDFRVIAPDNRGSGRTRAHGPAGYTIQDMASDVVGLMSSLDLGPSSVLGHSLGGMIAQQVALDYPQIVSALVLCSTNCGGLQCVPPSDETVAKLTDRSGTMEEQACRYTSTLFPGDWARQHPEYVAELSRQYMMSFGSEQEIGRQFMASVRFDSCERLGDVSCPTMVVCGGRDEVIPASNSRILADRIPGARLVEFADGGHAFMDQFPEEFARVLTEFLQ